jgi:hypothetical protein
MGDPNTAPTALAASEMERATATARARQWEVALLQKQLAAQYREEMLALRRGLNQDGTRPPHHGGGGGGKRWLDDQAEADVQQFLKTLSEKKEQKKYQLSLIKEYLADPSRFGGQADVIPTSTTLEEFEERKRDLTFRMGLLKMLLALAEEEMHLLLRAEAYTRAEAEKTAEAASSAPLPQASSA